MIDFVGEILLLSCGKADLERGVGQQHERHADGLGLNLRHSDNTDQKLDVTFYGLIHTYTL